MASRKSRGAFLLLPFLFFSLAIPSQISSATDTLTQSQPISVGQTLISSGQIFQLGFFNSSHSTRRYIGIWYKNISKRRVLWVANRENPLSATDSNSSLTIGRDGNLRILDGNGIPIWETNISLPSSNSPMAVLSDKGNLILKDSVSGLTLWESFNYPADTFLPGMMIGLNTQTGEKRFLSGWLAKDDPSGPWDGSKFIGIRDKFEGYGNGFTLISDNYFTYSHYSSSNISFLVVTTSGSWDIVHWDNLSSSWNVSWSEPGHPCDTYGFCGDFGICNKNGAQICGCLKGFVPNSDEEWRKEKWSGGCKRDTELLCDKNSSGLSLGGVKSDGFFKLSRVKLPDRYVYLHDMSESGCEKWCLSNCSCVAYSYVAEIGCMVWAGGGLVDIQQFSSAGEDLFLRLAASELGKDKKKEKLIISLTTASGVILLGVVIYGLHRLRAKQKGKMEKKTKDSILSDRLNNSRDMLVNQGNPHDTKLELPTIDFEEIAAATDNFSISSKIGEGGFGPVFKGIARGLLYLHRDSCLKIIHRDLKVSNILLDEEMNPKISDFGLARTFLCTQELANTHKVVGTLGYMSPEYAMGGIFSEKSDVFSFGVLLLEIVSGKKNNSFRHNEAWDLWNEGRAMDLVDQVLADSCSLQEVTRCLHVGLLCVQDHAADRPTMSTVVLMLSSEIDCPQPKRPTFTFQSLAGSSDLRSQSSNNVNSINVITVSMVEGR
ncbi:hypothetical protein RHSIM_Rhsim02G0119900 [Rhododendron simsii]|uniref:Receptor-like serine/threonine-protein kinase n=1 Tax=Rhododendron simsii TaxID=118357 RepID=A0A834HED0_RHOSS|nr:hypothetical protein RHSIM_Rhsim02G0119900 [Rhododendron simsii]